MKFLNRVLVKLGLKKPVLHRMEKGKFRSAFKSGATANGVYIKPQTPRT